MFSASITPVLFIVNSYSIVSPDFTVAPSPIVDVNFASNLAILPVVKPIFVAIALSVIVPDVLLLLKNTP